MKTAATFLMTMVLAIGVVVLFSGVASAQVCDSTGNHYYDHNGDGFNDNAPDHDGDGIPNGQDPDWEAPKDGTGYQHKNQKGEAVQTMNKGEAKQVGKTDEDKSLSSEGSGNQYKNAIKTQNKGEAGESFQNKQQLGFKAGEAKGDGEGQGVMNQTRTRTQTKAQNKGELKQQFQNKVQTFTRTQTMTQLQQRNQVNAGTGPAAGSGVSDGAGSGTGSGTGNCDGTGPKEPKRNGGDN